MAYIKAITYYQPDEVITNEQLEKELGGIEQVAKTAGVDSRRKAAEEETASDLAVKAAEKLFEEHGLKPSEIDFLIFCTQSPDYFMPSASCIIQDRLGIPTTAGAFGYDLGCSGYVYGLAIANSFVDSGLAKNVLLLTADTISKYLHPQDKNRLLFGDAASATLVAPEGAARIGAFERGSDGSGLEHIIIRNGGNRHRAMTGNSRKDENGNIHYDDYFDMDGEAVFNFTVERIPELMKNCLAKNEMEKEDVGFYVFHQANKYMLNTLRKLNKLPKDAFFVDLSDTGNTTSSTVPIGLVKSMKDGRIHEGMNVMVAGFGVGLSWAATILKF